MIIRRFTFIFVLFICRAPRRRIFAKGDVFAALSQLQDLVSLEQTLGQSLDVYLEAERARLDRIKRFARTVKAATERVKLEGLESLNNPGNSYGVVKRFVSGWRKLDSLLGQDYALGKTRCFDRVYSATMRRLELLLMTFFRRKTGLKLSFSETLGSISKFNNINNNNFL